ncbi:hypothetical protein AHAS_Ahas13G0288300 [Arachis hypogaea]
MRVFGSRRLVSMVVQSYVEDGVHRHMVVLVGNYKGSTIDIGVICILEWLLFIVHWRRLLPRGLIKSLRFLPPLIVPSLMQVLIVASISYNIS